MHRTLNRATAQPAAASLPARQRRFEAFRREYNQWRPHEALDQSMPGDHYEPSPRSYPDKVLELSDPAHFDVRAVATNGAVCVHNGQLYVSHLLRGERVGLEQVGDGIWDVYFGPVRLGGFNLRDVKGGNTPDWTIRV